MKTAVVLGATAGVGKAIIEQLGCDYYATIGFHRGHYSTKSLRANRLVQHDATDVEIGIEAVKSFLEDDEQVNVLVHCITGASVGSILTRTRDDVERTFNNLAHSFLEWVQTLYLNEMLSPTARLIALSNPCPDFYLRNTGVIGAAKAALEAYVKMLAVELGPSGVRVNCVRFGMVKTPAIEKVLSETALQHMQKVNERLMPAGRMQTVEDVAKTVKWLVSDNAYWLNGAIIDATGGCTSTLMDAAFYGSR